MPTFAFPKAPATLTDHLLRRWNAPLPNITIPIASVPDLMPVYYRCPTRSTSELLRTL